MVEAEAPADSRPAWTVAERAISLIPLDLQTRERILHCIKQAEIILNDKLNKVVAVVQVPEIHAVWTNTYEEQVDMVTLIMQIQNLYREDLFYADRQMTGWSADKDDTP